MEFSGFFVNDTRAMSPSPSTKNKSITLFWAHDLIDHDASDTFASLFISPVFFYYGVLPTLSFFTFLSFIWKFQSAAMVCPKINKNRQGVVPNHNSFWLLCWLNEVNRSPSPSFFSDILEAPVSSIDPFRWPLLCDQKSSEHAAVWDLSSAVSTMTSSCYLVSVVFDGPVKWGEGGL